MPLVYWEVLGLAALSGITTVIGVMLAIRVGKDTRWLAFGIGFSSGIMLLISTLELLPEAWSTGGAIQTIGSALAGIFLVALLHWVIPHTHMIKEQGIVNGGLIRTAYLVAVGLILHDVPEGFAMANSYLHSQSMGIFVAIGIALHNIPEEFAIAVPALAAKDYRLLYKAAILSALAEPLGAIVGLSAAHILPQLITAFISVAAGAMIYISIHELIPLARRYGKGNFFILGFLVSALTYWALENQLG